MRTALVAIGGVGALLVLTACDSDGDAAPSEWQPPAWFAEQARQREEVKQILQDCVTAKGWDYQVDEYGGSEVNLATLPDKGEQFIADINTCYADIPESYVVVVDEAYIHDVLYPQEVDVYDCLVAQGITPEPPPPVDVWVEDYLAMDSGDTAAEVWLPWGSSWVDDFVGDGSHTYDDLVALELVCPQPYTAP